MKIPLAENYPRKFPSVENSLHLRRAPHSKSSPEDDSPLVDSPTLQIEEPQRKYKTGTSKCQSDILRGEQKEQCINNSFRTGAELFLYFQDIRVDQKYSGK